MSAVPTLAASTPCPFHEDLVHVYPELESECGKLFADKKATEYFHELKVFNKTTYHVDQRLLVKETIRAWMLSTAAKFFFDEMDYFDGTEATLNAKADVFLGRLKLCETVFVNSAMHGIHFAGLRLPFQDREAVLALWRKMLLTVDKTQLYLWESETYSVFTIPKGSEIRRRHNCSEFHTGYMKNITNLSRKALEAFVENKKIEFQIAVNKLEIANLTRSIKEDHAQLKEQLAAHITEYNKMSYAFDESVKANKALQAKVAAQDILIADLSTKMSKIIDLFGWFKEEVPRTMLRGLADRVSASGLIQDRPAGAGAGASTRTGFNVPEDADAHR